jgi:hypothetical protein
MSRDNRGGGNNFKPSGRKGGGFKLGGTPADIEAKKRKAALKKERLEKSQSVFSTLNFEGSFNSNELKYLKPITSNEIGQIAFEQGQSSFNAKEYADKAMEAEKHVEYMAGLSKKEQKKVNRKGGSKAAMIRAEVSAKQQQKKDDGDSSIIQRLKNKSTIDDSIINDYLRMKTDSGIVQFLIEAIKIGLKSNSDLIPHMYLELINLEPCEFETQVKNLIKRVNQTLEMSPEKWIQTQMTDMSCYLPPLNKFSRREKKLDDWQKHIMKCIDQNKNVILVAKTSAGKTVCSTYTVWKADRVLYVLPSAELAEQVFGLIHNQLGGHTMMVINRDVFHMSDNVKVVVGTPYALESFLAYNPKLEFDYTVYDEVHGLNGQEGDSLENLIKTVKGNFLALSATVENPEELSAWWKSIRPEMEQPELVKHDSRFIVQQRYLWHNESNKLETLNPLAAVDDLEYLQQGGLKKGTLSFTSKDTYGLWEKVKDKYPQLSPDKYFQEKNILRLTLDDSKDYERFLKNEIQKLSLSEPEVIMSIMESYQTDYAAGTENKFEIYNLIRWLFSKKMTPALCFQLDQDKVQKMFSNLVQFLQDGENQKYPWYRSDIELQHKFYEDFITKKDAKLQNVKIPKGENSPEYLDNISKEVNEEILTAMQLKFTDMISKRKIQIDENSEYSTEERKNHHKYCDNKMREIINMRILPYTNPYQAHPEFSFNDGLIDDNGMRDIKKRLSKQLGTNLSYDHPLMLGIERGISMYFDALPLPFQRVIKALFCDKKLTVLFSDETLAYGVNMPVRTVALIGDNINPLVAQQMAGRAGRRGVDNQGHVVYVNSKWREILKGTLPKIVGHNSISPYNVLRMNFLQQTENMIGECYKQTLQDFIVQKPYASEFEAHKTSLTTYLQESEKVSSRLIWNLRGLQNNVLIPLYMEYMLVKYNDVKQDALLIRSREIMEEIVTLFDDDQEDADLEINLDLVRLTRVLNRETGIDIIMNPKSDALVTSYTENRITDLENKINIVKRFKKINSVIQEIHKIILTTKFDKNKKMLEYLFTQIKKLISKYEDTGS